MDTLAIISGLIDQASTVEDDRKKKHAQQLQALIDNTRAKGIEQLGEAWSWLEPILTEKVCVKDEGHRVDIEWNLVDGKTYELKLAPFEICVSTDGYRGTKILVWRGRSYDWTSFQINQIAQAIFTARERFQTYDQELTEAYVKDRIRLLEWWQNEDEAKALQAHRELVDGVPARKAEWDQRLNSWIKAHDEKNQLRREKEEAAIRHNALEENFKLQYAAYLQARETALEHNRKVLAPIQGLLDVPFECWELTYAIFARDEEGYAEVETRTVWLTRPQADPESGEYLCLNDRKVKFYNPVSLEKYTFKPSDEISGSYRKISLHGVSIFVSSKMDPEHVNEIIESAGFMPLPDEPGVPDGLSDYDVRQIKRELTHAEPEIYF